MPNGGLVAASLESRFGVKKLLMASQNAMQFHRILH